MYQRRIAADNRMRGELEKRRLLSEAVELFLPRESTI